jgi:type II secretory pathway component PulC
MNALRRHLVLTLWLASGVGVALTVLAFRATPWPSLTAVPAVGRVALQSAANRDTLSRATDHLVDTDPFRLDHRAAAVAYDPSLTGKDGAPVAIVRPPRPTLVLKGIIASGHPPVRTAMLDGVPGRAATAIVRVGDTLSGLTVRHIGRDTVVVSATDTTWRLTVRQAWQ